MTSSPLSPLPVDEVLPQGVDLLREQGRLVLLAPTGAGKTTRVPPAIRDSGIIGDQTVLMLQPRRLAARTAARRIADERNVTLGDEVGYQVRFDSRHGKNTRILVVTEGVLLRRLQVDPFLEGIGAVLFDEFHERNINSDVALAMTWRIRQTVRSDLKIVVMSASLDPQPVSNYLGQAPILESQGRMFPVKIEHRVPRNPLNLPQLAAWGTEQVLTQSDQHILVFLPGVGEIHRTARELEPVARRHNLQLLPLYGEMPASDQDQVLAPSEQRKVILATNVAETSLTIDGVTAVVDAGVARVLRFDAATGLNRLQLEPISQASAEQRAGRAGRTQPGVCLRLWEQNTHRHRPAQTDAEIRRVDLAGPVLQLKCWGENQLLEFPWFEVPPVEALHQAEELLKKLGALDDQGEVTPQGRIMSMFPVHPRLARLILAGRQWGEEFHAAWLAALLSERDPFFKPRQQGRGPIRTTVTHHSRSDVLDRLFALEEQHQTPGHAGEFPWGTVNRGASANIRQVRDQLLRFVREELEECSSLSESLPRDEALMRALVLAFPDRVAVRRAPRSEQGLMVGGRGVKLMPQSSVREGEFFLCVDVDAGQANAVVRQASSVKREWLPEESLRMTTEVFFHPSQKQVVARKREYFDDLILSETPASLPESKDVGELLFTEAMRHWQQIFPKDQTELSNYLQRVRSLQKWIPELKLPEWNEESLQEVLRQLCLRCTSFAELKKADWLSELQSQLTWEQRLTVDREAPEKMNVPSGSQIRLEYQSEGSPILAVRIQEIFGLQKTPTIAGGRIPVLLHLLGPNYRPQQVTNDLESFWKNTYPQVRKELARRYPKHPWPEDPVTANPIRK